MKYEMIADYSNTRFRRITGVKRAAFQKMVEILQEAYAQKPRPPAGVGAVLLNDFPGNSRRHLRTCIHKRSTPPVNTGFYSDHQNYQQYSEKENQ